MRTEHMDRIFRIALAAVGLLAAPWVLATHLVGGNLGYVYMGETSPGSQVYRYQIYMEFYMNCGPNSNFQTFDALLNQTPSHTLPVGVYLQDPQNPNANKQQQAVVDLSLVSEQQIIPPFPDNCSVGQGLCTLLGRFEGTVDLPLSFSGYHLYFQMCCRNLDIDNLANPNNTGIGYYAFIPPTLVNNSSPVFLGVPTPLLCTSDTTTFVNSASDPDGDQLIFSFQTPYNSVSQQGGIQPPPNVLPWPVPTVAYNAGFSVSQPFGAGGYSFINGATGLTEYLPPIQGNYVVAVEVKEFRNGQLIGITRRDLQLQAIPCPPNNTPQISGQLPTSYTVNAGQQLCFPMSFLDVDNDTVTLTASGTIFDGNLFNPPATINSPVVGHGTVSSQFCWNTSCDEGQQQPYLFSVSVMDNGCPPKSVDVVFQINVVPFTGPTTISGPAQVCTQQGGVIYSTPNIAGADFHWTVTGGNITSGESTSAIVVQWGAPGPGTVQVSATNALGCTSQPVSLSVNVVALPAASAGPDRVICPGTAVQIGGSPTGPSGSSFSWSPAGTLSSGTAANPNASPAGTTSYIVQVSNSGCVNRDTVRVVVSQPTVDAGPDVSLCVGDTVQLHATGTGSITWSPAQGLSATNIPDPLAFPTVTITYHATLTDSVNCTATDSVRVTVNPVPLVDAGPDTSACINETIMLGGSPTGPLGSVFAWSPAQGLNATDEGNPNATITVDQTYTVVVTDDNGCVNSDQVTVVALPIPSVDAGADTSICAGQVAQLHGTGSGTLQWSPIFGLSDPNIGDPFANPEVTTTYTLTVTGGNFCTNTDQTTVIVHVLPNANAGPDLAICVGDTAHIQATGPGTYTWTPSATLNDPNVPDPLAFPTVTTTYTLTLTDSLTCSRSDSMMVIVYPLPFANAGLDRAICPGTSTVLGGAPTGPAGSTYQWAPAGTLDDPTSDAPTASPAAPTDYIVHVTDANTCSYSDTVSVTFLDAPSANAGPDTSICPGASVELNGSGNGVLSWSPTATLSDPNIPDPVATPAVTTTYTLTVVGDNTCIGHDDVVVTVLPPPPADAGADAGICPGDSTQLQASGGVSYVWSPAMGLSSSTIPDPFAHPTTTTVYTVSVTDAAGCSASDSVTVTANPFPTVDAGADQVFCAGGSATLGGNPTGPSGSTFTWSPGTGLSSTSTANPTAQPTSTTTYTVQVTDANQCSASDDVTVTVNALPTLDAGADTSFCMGGDVHLNASGTGQFSWSPSTGLSDAGVHDPVASPGSTTTYTVTLTDGDQCTATDDITVTVLGLPNADAGEDQYLCPGFSVQLHGTGGGSIYNWSPAGSLDNATIADPQASPISTTTYTFTITDGNGCSASDQVQVQVSTDPPIDAGADQSVCQGQQVTLGGNPTSIPGVSYLWSPSAGLSDPTAANPTATPTATTVYTLTVTSDTCTSHDQVQVSLQGLATAAFTMRLEPSCEDLRAFFTDESSGATQWLWDFGDGTTSTERNPEHRFDYGHDIVVTLTVTDGLGCTGAITQTFPVSSFSEYVNYFIPNVFTPNGDGKHDLFTVESNALLGPCVSMFVFNRWGQKVFESFGNSIAWDGRNFAGEPCTPGTYFYTLKVKDMSFNGNVYLNR